MITKNYVSLKLARLITRGTSATTLDTPIKTTSGSQVTSITYNDANSDYNRNACLFVLNSAIFGTGTSQESADDYNLAEPINTLSNVTVTTTHIVDIDSDGKSCFKVSFIINATNNTSDSITIKEVGITKTLYNGSWLPVLLARKVLDTPITVAAGGSFTLPLQWIEY